MLLINVIIHEFQLSKYWKVYLKKVGPKKPKIPLWNPNTQIDSSGCQDKNLDPMKLQIDLASFLNGLTECKIHNMGVLNKNWTACGQKLLLLRIYRLQFAP